MNLRQIIRESINSVILDSIISEEIIKEAGSARRNMRRNGSNNNRQTTNQNLKQYKQQHNSHQNASYSRNNPNWYSQTPQPEQSQEVQQGGYGYTNSGFEDAGHDAPQQTKQPQQATPQGQQQQTVDFSQYAEQLRNLIGNKGIDPSPVQNNQAAVQHINKLNQLIYYTINAIESGNINSVSSPATGGSNRRNDPYGRDRTDIALDGTNRLVNGAGELVDYMGSVGGSNNPLQGVGSAFSKAHGETNNAVANYLNQKKFVDAYGSNKQNGNGGVNLTYLMQSANDGCYPNLSTEYNQINQTNNGIFSAVPNVSECHQVLQNLATAVANYNNSQKQQTQQVQQTTNGENNAKPMASTDVAQQPDAKTNAKDNEYLHKLAGRLQVLQNECNSISLNKKIDGNVANAAGWMRDLCKDVVSANDTNNTQQLIKLLSLDGREYEEIPTYNAIKEIYNTEHKNFKEEPGYKGIMTNMEKTYKYLTEFRINLAQSLGIAI
jgi:hypothetical protein